MQATDVVRSTRLYPARTILPLASRHSLCEVYEQYMLRIDYKRKLQVKYLQQSARLGGRLRLAKATGNIIWGNVEGLMFVHHGCSVSATS